MTIRLKLRPLVFALCCASSLAARSDEAPDFSSWLAQFRQEALAQGISQATLDAALADARPLPEVIERDQRQPEFFQTFWSYLDKRLSPWRIERGQALLQEHRVLLDEVQTRYGVPASILVAFWGLETNYGAYLGDFPIPVALATLAFDPRRGDFFRRELLQSLRIIEAGHVAAADMKGSWAGAMGQVQFMPSTYLRYAVDGDGDGHKNLWVSLPDAFNSAAHFLRELGWQPGEIWGREVRLPANFDWESAQPKVKKPVNVWARLGVTQADGLPLPKSDMAGAIVLPQGHAGPAFLVYRNFEVIMGWNRSLSYALAVGLLSDRLLGQPALLGGRDADNRPLSREQVMEMQRQLAARGLDVGEPDGLPGPRTRLAIRAWQKTAGLPVDGYASLGLLEQLQAAK
ncbi:MAG: lytic murein transglycosylase [Gallionellaceae bacterium]|nr:lytic murein transglycosylase [Gallionellaceae bacterium]